MKKSFKILTLVLSLALLCGALVVAVLADEPADLTGITTCFTTDFTGVTGGGSATGNKELIKSQFNVDNKGSGSSNVIVDKYGNSYFSYDYEGDDRAPTATNYSYTAPNPGTAWTTPSSLDTFKGWYYTDNKYYVIDFDVYFPEGVPNGHNSFYFYNYIPTYIPVKDEQGNIVKDEQGNTTMKWSNDTEPTEKAFQWKFKNGDNGSVVVQTNSGKSYELLDGAWTHLTGFVTYEIAEDGTFYIISYTALNGQIVDVAKVALPKKTSATDPTAWWPKTIRFDFSNKDSAGREMDIDNITLRKLDKTYNGNLDEIIAQGIGADATKWESDVYKNGEKTPYTNDAAEVNGVKYDHVQRAIAAAKAGDTITLLKNCDTKVNVDKAVTIACGEYTMEKPDVALGLVADYNEETKSYVVAPTQQAIMIMFNTCTCPDCTAEGATPDASHPGNVFVEAAYRDNDIFNFYVNAGKSLEWSLNKGIVAYKLIGWVDQNGNPVKSGDVVTEAMLEAGYLIISPVIETSNATVEYVKGGATTYGAGDNAFKDAITNADAGTTVKLIGNTKYAGAALTVAKALTLDLNGYMLQAVSTKDQVASKPGLFALSTADFTVLGEQEGSALISFYVEKVNVKADGTVDTGVSFNNNPTFTMGNSKATTLTFKGENLYVNAAQLLRINASNKTVKIDGGTYARDKASDGMATIYGAGSVTNTTVEVKNAIVTGSNFMTWYNTAGNTATIDNCVLLCGQGNLFNKTYGFVEATITNSYIACNVSCSNATITLGEGNYIRDNSNWDSSVVYATGVVTEAVSNKVTHEYPMTIPMANKVDGKYVVYDSTYDILPGAKEITYTKYTKKATIVNFYDGETLLGSATGDPGMKVVGPTKGEPEKVADGWVNQYTAYAYTIPAGTTDAVINVDIKDVTEYGYTYTAGTPTLYLNYRLSDNLATNLYRPATLPEGIELVDTILNGSNTGRKWEGNWTIGGVEYVSTQGWPTAWGADENSPKWELMYTYEGTTLSYTVQANVVKYAQKVAETYAGDAEKQQQMVALLQYVEAANKIKGQTPANGLSDYLAGLKETVKLFEIAEETYDLTAISTYISSASLGINSGRGGSLKFTLTDAGKAEGIKVKIVGSVNSNALISSAIESGALVTDNSHLPSWGAHKFTIVVYTMEQQEVDGEMKDVEKVLASADYSLAAYYTAKKDVLTDDQKSMVEAIYAISKIGNTNN